MIFYQTLYNFLYHNLTDGVNIPVCQKLDFLEKEVYLI